ncbi:P-loop containing nucleoside triphosphate hydrolase protein [Dendrothele bispora CBS 962.96]|uniref:DNA 3'-5' helicase n=1 Tax=Dendrothele bispora (strain CBS 962.96) TaxID=1314807 RepID=A0A4S8M061_DENBC|nr:P-loop containing nucleoside triphosphate hydrolase protein [Dendrothele bispora CBS 962.96]
MSSYEDFFNSLSQTRSDSAIESTECPIKQKLTQVNKPTDELSPDTPSNLKEQGRRHTCRTYVQYLKTLSTAELKNLTSQIIPTHLFPLSYIESLEQEQKIICYHLCLACWSASRQTQCPKELQLTFACSILKKKDVFLNAGTGFGKTLSAILPQLLCDGDGSFTIIVSLLKRLQHSQANGLMEKYGLQAVTVNEDPQVDANHAYNFPKKTRGCTDVFIVTPEQFFMSKEGHLTRFAKFIRNRTFSRWAFLVVIDEAHLIPIFGLPRYGLSLFRPVYGKLDEIKTMLGPAVIWAAMTATAPCYMLKSIETRVLRPNYVNLSTTSNRSDITYATHCVPGGIDRLENYGCFLSSPFVFETQKRVLIFRDNKDSTVKIARYLDNLLPLQHCGRGEVVRHYHSLMSADYLKDAHDEFTKPDGKCKILVATAGESTGIDHPDVEIVCLAGLPSDITAVLQRGGRAVRQISCDGLCVIFYDNWVNEIDLTEYGLKDGFNMESFDFDSDIDRPPKNVLTSKSTVKERASLACVLLTKRSFCLRLFFSKCLHDDSPEALEFFTAFCCDAHNNGFNLQRLLPGKLYNPDTAHKPSDVPMKKSSNPKPRSSANKKQLRKLFEQWLEKAHEDNPMSPVWPVYYILSESHLKTLVSTAPHSIVSERHLISLLKQTDDWAKLWAADIFKIISTFDAKNEKMSSPEIIEDSEWYESDWEELFEKEKETRIRMEKVAHQSMGEKRFLEDLELRYRDSQSVFLDVTNM